MLSRRMQQFASQLPVIGSAGQSRLHQARVHEFGHGRVMMAVTLNLAAVGVGHISANDPQILGVENLGPWIYSRNRDLEREKVYVTERFLDGRDACFEPLVARNESPAVDPLCRRADLLISGANTVAGRVAAVARALRYRKPLLDIAIFDGRQALGGCVKLWVPENKWAACPACYLRPDMKVRRGEGLLWSVVAIVAGIASNMVVQLLTGLHDEGLKIFNLFVIDAANYRIESLAVERRRDCQVCGARDKDSR